MEEAEHQGGKQARILAFLLAGGRIMEIRGSGIQAQSGGAPEAQWIGGLRSGSSIRSDPLSSGFGIETLVGERGDEVLCLSPDDALVRNGPGESLARIIGSGADDVFAVETGLAFDAPSVFVFERSGPEVGRTELNGIDRLEILGLGGDDRLSVGAWVYGDRDVPVLGGVARLDGVDVIVFRAGAGDDKLDGDEADGPLVAYGGSGDDRLEGGSGADILRGGAGRDVLAGRFGDDVLDGGLGADRLKGGSGRDVFIYQDIADAPLDETALDRIQGFTRGRDVIDLSAIEVIPGGYVIDVDDPNAPPRPIHDSFEFLGNFSPEIQILNSGALYYDPEEQALKGFVGGYVSYEPNFAIALPGVEALNEADLILTG
jgi:Ca2+-binding RTX toxin-like protein